MGFEPITIGENHEQITLTRDLLSNRMGLASKSEYTGTRVLDATAVFVAGAHIPEKVCKYATAKRLFDIVGASLFLLVFFPFFLLIALIVKLTSKGPVLYKSERIGKCGRPFQFLKFRSMYTDADKRLDSLLLSNEKDGPIFKMKNDPRITPIGRFMRKYSIDELPQFINVLKGDMSLVGPRPPIRREVERYDEAARQRLSVQPGLTCYWQIMGRSNLSFAEWMELDRKYIEDMSFGTDLKILWNTPKAVLKGEGAY
jgi:exopolysaccharide biosynthesis polyprenyl glycosylphosphotransferase